jgi:hypothetical protein
VIRAMFMPENVMSSDWYRARLAAKQRVDIRLWERHVDYLEKFLRHPSYAGVAERMGIADRLESARAELAAVHAVGYLDSLTGMTGAEPAIPEPAARCR